MTISPAWLSGQFPELSKIVPIPGGGQKSVFTAIHPDDGDVVLKLMHLHQDAETVRREILAVMRIGSRRVPKILAQGQLTTPFGSFFWLREQRVTGQSLRSLLPKNRLGPRELLRCTHHLLEALTDAEKVKIVHRDVKPDNVMRDVAGNYWLLDFGIARHLELDSMTPTASPFGKVTVGYAPPEQCRNMKADIDARADLFALGVTIHEMATGINPFREGARDPLEVLQRVENEKLMPLRLPITDPESFSDLLSAMTQKRRDHRVATAYEALAWCEEVLVKEGMI